jgi:hypothetical protein
MVPQFAVGAGKVIGALLLIVPLVPLLAAVVPAPCVPDQFVMFDVTAARA